MGKTIDNDEYITKISKGKLPWHVDAIEIDKDNHIWANYMFDVNGIPIDLRDSSNIKLIVDSVNSMAKVSTSGQS